MSLSSSTLSILQSSLESLSPDILERVNRLGGLQTPDFIEAITKPKDHSVYMPEEVSSDVVQEIVSEDNRLGEESFSTGGTAFCILAGGYSPNDTLLQKVLDVKLRQSSRVKHVWIMSSPSNHSRIQEIVNKSPGGGRVHVFSQFESIRLTANNQIHMQKGMPSLHPCGHGDLVHVLLADGILQSFTGAGGKRVAVVNASNLLAGPNSSVLTHHIKNNSNVTCEVVERKLDDKCGVLCNDVGVNRIVESFLLERAYPEEFTWSNTNSMIFDARLPFDTLESKWHRVKKNVGGKLLVQYERLLQDLTSTFKTSYVKVDRNQRFFPVKTKESFDEACKLLKL